MRERLKKFIGATAYQVPIFTFHGFANELIALYPDAYEQIIGGKPILDLQRFTLVEDLLLQGDYKVLRPVGDPRYYVKQIISTIGKLKQENILPDDLARHIQSQQLALQGMEKVHEKGAHKGKVKSSYLEAEKYLKRNEELLNLYRSYLAYLKAEHLYDFEDMILETIVALETNPDMLLSLQEQYLYLLADEHQDVNKSQNRLLELLASYHPSPNLFVVGDEKQAIYRFQGASLENFLYFTDLYPEATIINLTTNYRSSQKILDLASDFIKSDDPDLTKLRTPLVAANTFATTIAVSSFANVALEEAYLVEKVKKCLSEGIEPEEIAILTRTNQEVKDLSLLLSKANLPTRSTADRNLLSEPAIKSIINLIQALTPPIDDVALLEVLHAPYTQIANRDLVRFLTKRNTGIPLREQLTVSVLDELEIENPEPFLAIMALQEKVRSATLHQSLSSTLELMLHESGLLDFLLKNDLFNSSNDVRRLYDEVMRLEQSGEVSTLGELLRYFNQLHVHDLPLSALALTYNEKAINVLTAHKAKGLEFSAVFLPHQTDAVWSNKKRSETFSLPQLSRLSPSEEILLDDERRLFYVALTRAKSRLYFSWGENTISGRPCSLSRHLLELNQDFIEVNSTIEFSEQFVPLSLITLPPKIKLEKDYLRSVLSSRGWSATSFNNYRKSPWEYIYKNVLRVPTIKTPELQFGSAVHLALERLTWRLKAGENLTVNLIKNVVNEALRQNSVTASERVRQEQRGFDCVAGYLPTLEGSLTSETKTEYPVKVLLPTGDSDFPEVVLTGNFDRVDLESGKVVRVVDYKTGKTKTRGVIEGKTKDSDGNYKRQLTFYALLLSLQNGEEAFVVEYRLSFVEPDKKGVIHEESFYISHEEVEELKSEIISATKAVVSGEVLQTNCDPEKCHFCHLLNGEVWE